ncbi:MAG TPA: DUF5709 domain-containing protein [Actinospica sp.]|nr:DUF5709 domain-containing protein [Actinospica sp.]
MNSRDQTGQRMDTTGQETQDVPEDDGVLQPADTLETDDLARDPLDIGISPPERHPASERFGVTEAEARRGETLDQRLAQEEPDEPATGSGERAGRLTARDAGMLSTAEPEPSQIAHDVGEDGGGASAEEAAVHVIPEEES